MELPGGPDPDFGALDACGRLTTGLSLGETARAAGPERLTVVTFLVVAAAFVAMKLCPLSKLVYFSRTSISVLQDIALQALVQNMSFDTSQPIFVSVRSKMRKRTNKAAAVGAAAVQQYTVVCVGCWGKD